MTTSTAATTNFILLLLFFSIVLLANTQSSNGNGNCRVLHEPLLPIDRNAPAPPPDFPDPPPDSPALFFRDSPPPPNSGPTPTAAKISGSLRTITQRSSATRVAVGVSILLAMVLLLSLSAFFLYQCRARRSAAESGELIGGGGSESAWQQVRRSSASAEFLYLGTVDPSSRRGVSGEANVSQYSKLNPEAVVELRHPSPELQPLPPLIGPDEDSFYTPHHSVAAPRSRRPSPIMHVPACTPSDVKHAILPMSRAPPPPPTRPPTPKLERIVKAPAPSSPPSVSVGMDRLPSGTSVEPALIRPSSRRQLLRPLPAGAVRLDPLVPLTKLRNGGCSSSSALVDENLENDTRPRLKPLHLGQSTGGF